MSDKEKLDIACTELRRAIKNGNLNNDYRKKWVDFALLGSVQTRRERERQNQNYKYANR